MRYRWNARIRFVAALVAGVVASGGFVSVGPVVSEKPVRLSAPAADPGDGSDFQCPYC